MQQYLQNKKGLVDKVFNKVFDKYDLGLRKFASEAEFQMSIGNPPEIELKAHETKSKRVETFEIPKEGIDLNM